MKKTMVAAIVLVSILAIILATWLVTNNAPGQPDVQNDEAEVTKVEITKFVWTDSGMGPAYPEWWDWFNITIRNSGTTNLTGLSAEVKWLANGTQVWSETEFSLQGTYVPAGNFTFDLLAGESREFQGIFARRLDGPQGNKVFVAIMLNNTVLDEL
jgi:hypothetical protein